MRADGQKNIYFKILAWSFQAGTCCWHRWWADKTDPKWCEDCSLFPLEVRDLHGFCTPSALDDKPCVPCKKRAEWVMVIASKAWETSPEAMKVQWSLNTCDQLIQFWLSQVYSGFSFSVSSVIFLIGFRFLVLGNWEVVLVKGNEARHILGWGIMLDLNVQEYSSALQSFSHLKKGLSSVFEKRNSIRKNSCLAVFWLASGSDDRIMGC